MQVVQAPAIDQLHRATVVPDSVRGNHISNTQTPSPDSSPVIVECLAKSVWCTLTAISGDEDFVDTCVCVSCSYPQPVLEYRAGAASNHSLRYKLALYKLALGKRYREALLCFGECGRQVSREKLNELANRADESQPKLKHRKQSARPAKQNTKPQNGRGVLCRKQLGLTRKRTRPRFGHVCRQLPFRLHHRHLESRSHTPPTSARDATAHIHGTGRRWRNSSV